MVQGFFGLKFANWVDGFSDWNFLFGEFRSCWLGFV